MKVSPSLAAFLVLAFVVVGLVGVFATYAAPLARDRALAREVVLDQALATGGNREALEALRPRLGDSAAALLPPGPDFAAQVARERTSMRERLRAEADATDQRLRLLIVVITVMAAAFGVVLLNVRVR